MTPLLSLRSVSVVDDSGPRPRTILSDVSLDLEPGELCGIWGARAAGKSTLLAVAGGRMRPTSGAVYFDGCDLAKMSDPELADLRGQEIGWVQTSPPEWELPVRDWVALSAPERPAYAARPRVPARRSWRSWFSRVKRQSYGQSERDAEDLLVKVGIKQERLGLRWSELTHSERPLAGIANALIREPRLLIADDPTAALDLKERDRVAVMLRILAEDKGIALLMSAPDSETVQFCKREGNLSSGHLIMGRRREEPETEGTVIPLPRQRGASGQ